MVEFLWVLRVAAWTLARVGDMVWLSRRAALCLGRTVLRLAYWIDAKIETLTDRLANAAAWCDLRSWELEAAAAQ